MLAVLPESRESPRLGEVPDPAPAAGEVLLEVRATALNRADLLQLQGLYPPPPGESPIPGLECSGTVLKVGSGVQGWEIGDRAMALLAGGGHGEKVAVPAGQLMTIPQSLSYTQAAALPEVALTCWTNLVVEGGLGEGQILLVTAAASGVGSFAVQLARELGARVIVAGRSLERLKFLQGFGTEASLDLKTYFPRWVLELTDGQGVDLVLELVGGQVLERSLACLKPQGRLVLVGILGGLRSEIDLGTVLRRRLHIVGSVLRSRSREEKACLVRGFTEFAADRLADGRLEPVIHRVLPFRDITQAYRELKEGSVLGKIVLEL